MILTVTLNPVIDKTVFIPRFEPDGPQAAGKITFRQASNIAMIAGGKGNNVARVLRNFGYEVHSLNLLGGIEGKTVLNLLEAEGGETTPVTIQGRTREVVTLVETAGYRQVVYVGPSPKVTAEERNELIKAYKSLISRSALAVLSGSMPDDSLDGTFYEMILMAKTHGVRTILDTRDQALARGIAAVPYAVKPNLAEAEKLLGQRMDGEPDRWQALDRLASLGIPLVILSLGEQGVLARCQSETYRVSPPRVDVVNPIGSGDSLVAGLAMGIVDGRDIESTLKLGVAAGTANAAIWQAASITPEQVSALLPLVRLQRVRTGDQIAIRDPE